MYFVTICTRDRACLFGEVADGVMRLNQVGEIVETAWQAIPDHFPQVSVDEFVVMPNHVHGVLVFHDVGDSDGGNADVGDSDGGNTNVGNNNVVNSDVGNSDVGAQHAAPLRLNGVSGRLSSVVPASGAQHAAPLPPRPPPCVPLNVAPGSLGAVVRSFKSAATKKVNESRGVSGPGLWQRNYFEHIVRDDGSLARIRQYIRDNPARWAIDGENPDLHAEGDSP